LTAPAEEMVVVWAGSDAQRPLTLVSVADKLEDEHASSDTAPWHSASSRSSRLAFSRSFSWGAGALLGFPLPTRTCRSTSAAIRQHAVVQRCLHASGPFRAVACPLRACVHARRCGCVFSLASLPCHPPRGCGPFPACWAASGSGGDARTPTHARRMHGRKKRAIRADPPSVMRPGVDMRAVVAGSGTACICCAPSVTTPRACLQTCRVHTGSPGGEARHTTRSQPRPAPFLWLSPCTSSTLQG
jgi:hypothetical protein